ncbi:MAG: M6 family metalloprotease domain-containing protein, partial [Phycisphaerae bacterium]
MIRTKFAGWLVFSCLGLLAWAVPVLACVTSPIPVTLQQPDGTKITLRFRGDKYYHWFEDLAGYTVVRAGAAYYYAELGPHGELVATQHEVGKADPAALALPPKLKASARAIAEQRRRVLVSPPGPPPPITSIAPAGVVKNLVVLCKFSDHSFGSHTRPEADYDVLFNTIGGDPVLAPTGSVRDSYAENSYGIMDLQSTVAVWVTLPHPESYYTNGSSGLGGSYPQNPQGMVEDALNLVDALVDFGTFDTDNDGFIDAIDIVHSGYGAETGGGGGNWMWSHRWSLWALPGGDWVSNDTNASGNQVHVFDYHTEPALWGTSGTNIIRIGVIAHETGHFFGLPDLYDINGGGEGLGSYGMMANSWGFDFSQHFPPHFCAYSKIFLNWVSPVTISAPGTYSLTAVEISPEVFRVDQNYPGGEYLLIENRQPIGLDGDMPQGGLCIWHIDTAKSGNTDEGYPGQSGWPGNNQHYRVALLQADGNYDMEHGNNRGDGGDVYHAGGVNAINETTTPNTDSYQFGNVFATNNALSAISASGTTMTFTFGSLIDCNGNSIPDDVDIANGTSLDCNADGVPDECELGANDCNGNGIPDDCDIAGGLENDCNANLVPDSCEIGIAGTILSADFEAGLPASWAATGMFSVTGGCDPGAHCDGNLWAYAGNNGSCTYGDGQSGQLIAPPVTLGYGISTLTFCHRYDTEVGFDFCTLRVNGQAVWQVSGTNDAWHDEVVDLSAFNGQTVDVRWELVSDAFVSGTLGWQVDRIALDTGVPDCNGNGVPDACDIAQGTSQDLNGDGIPDECAGCTLDSQCDDGVFCNGVETCVAGVCAAGTPPDCSDGIACTIDACDPSADACVNVPFDDVCDNFLFCDGVEVCQAGVGCVSGSAPDCNDAIACTADACNEATDACDHVADDALCDNFLFCDGVEVCQAGVGCVSGSAPNCNDGIACTADSCNEATDACDHVTNDALCDNGLFCDGVETCQAGVGCAAGVAPDCNDAIACTADSCNEATDSCDHATDDALCDNGLFCDGAESCQVGVGCVNGTAPDCNDAIACTADACNEATDACDHVANDALCDNGLFCDGAESCQVGVGCVNGTAPDCNDAIACTSDACNEATDACDHVADDAQCDNGLFCDGVETCQAGVGCAAGVAPD